MRVLMFGRGTIATIYGWALHQAGHEVEFYVRPGRAADYGDEVQLDLIDARRTLLGKRVREPFRASLRESFGPEDGFDLIVISVAHHRLAEAAAFVAPRLGQATVLVFGNIWEEPLVAVAPLPADHVVFGFPFGGGGFDADGVLRGGLLRPVIIGRTGASRSPRESEVRAALGRAGLAVREETDMRGRMWVHFASDAGMFGQGVRSGGLANMIGDRRAFREAFLASRELIPLLEARGVDLSRHSGSMLPYRLPGLFALLTAWATTLSPIARASLAAHTDPRAAEPRAVLQDTLREARGLGIPTPLLEASIAALDGDSPQS